MQRQLLVALPWRRCSTSPPQQQPSHPAPAPLPPTDLLAQEQRALGVAVGAHAAGDVGQVLLGPRQDVRREDAGSMLALYQLRQGRGGGRAWWGGDSGMAEGRMLPPATRRGTSAGRPGREHTVVRAGGRTAQAQPPTALPQGACMSERCAQSRLAVQALAHSQRPSRLDNPSGTALGGRR